MADQFLILRDVESGLGDDLADELAEEPCGEPDGVSPPGESFGGVTSGVVVSVLGWLSVDESVNHA